MGVWGRMSIVFFPFESGIFGYKVLVFGGVESFFLGEHAGGDNLEDLEGGWM